MANSCLQYTKSSPERSPQAINPCEAATRSAANTNPLVRRLSSLLTIWWYKSVGLWCLAIAAVLTPAFIVLLVGRGQIAAAWLLGLVYLQRFVFVLADEVFDDGDALVVRYNDQTSRIPLRDIEAVDYSIVFDPPRIAIRSKTGARFVFMPFFHPRMCFFPEHPLVAELKHRIAIRGGK